MTIRVGFRPSLKVNGPSKRAVLIGCDAPLCEKALEVPVNLHATHSRCVNDAIRYLNKKAPNGWTVSHGVADQPLFWCGAHKKDEGKKSEVLWVPGS